jgi:hypothetical protein
MYVSVCVVYNECDMHGRGIDSPCMYACMHVSVCATVCMHVCGCGVQCMLTCMGEASTLPVCMSVYTYVQRLRTKNAGAMSKFTHACKQIYIHTYIQAPCVLLTPTAKAKGFSAHAYIHIYIHTYRPPVPCRHRPQRPEASEQGGCSVQILVWKCNTTPSDKC